MRDLAILFAGEVMRMQRYGITAASVVVLLVWVLTLHYVAPASIDTMFPLVMLVDSMMMSLLLVGVIMLFEKQEGATKSMLVLPVGKLEYLASKVMAAVMSSIVTLVLLLAYGLAFRSLSISVPGIVGGVILVSVAFAQAGLVLTYRARDFTTLLMLYFVFVIIFAVPTLLEALQVFEGGWVTTLQYLNPAKNALNVLMASTGLVQRADVVIGVAYLVVFAGVMGYLALKQFDTYAAKEIGG